MSANDARSLSTKLHLLPQFFLFHGAILR